MISEYLDEYLDEYYWHLLYLSYDVADVRVNYIHELKVLMKWLNAFLILLDAIGEDLSWFAKSELSVFGLKMMKPFSHLLRTLDLQL